MVESDNEDKKEHTVRWAESSSSCLTEGDTHTSECTKEYRIYFPLDLIMDSD